MHSHVKCTNVGGMWVVRRLWPIARLWRIRWLETEHYEGPLLSILVDMIRNNAESWLDSLIPFLFIKISRDNNLRVVH